MSVMTQSSTAAGRPGVDTTNAEAARNGTQPDRLLAQRGFFAGPCRVPDDLYCTVEQGDAVRERREIVVDPHSRVSMNTYFGRFPASYWQRWTSAAQVRLEATVSGTGHLSVSASDMNGSARVLARERVADAHDERVTLTTPIDRFVDGGALWLEIATDNGMLAVRDVRWSVGAPSAVRPTAVVMCTYNRADDCLHTLDALTADEESMAMVEAVYVIDQGIDTVESRAGFRPIVDRLGSALHYIRQDNLGGAGGFTRGLYEVADVEHEDHANVLFMDDDILLEPDTVVRMTAFANMAVEPMIVGAQMLYLLHPELAYSWAQTTDLRALQAGVPVPRNVLRVDVTSRRQELRVDAGYNAWWSCLIPSEIVARAGYPLPMFFQWDDVEYGHRARAHGYPTVTLAGAGVWHDDWDWKDGDSPTNYFNHRNSLITSALHTDFDPKAAAAVVRQRLLRFLISMRYGLAATVLKGVEDFLEGPGCLLDGGVEAMATVQKLRAEYPETQPLPASEVPGPPSTRRPLSGAPPPPSHERLVMAKRLLWQLMGKTRGSASVSHRDAYWWHVSRYATVVATDASQQGVRVHRLDRAALITLGRRTVRVLRRLRREGRAVARSYREATPELTSRQNWQRLFDGQ
jgi:galactofuranosylgalactofuranosylrhamnosyl-N-acetylglucosaminyl-diphospho-decaprenol beta-1,5/1,6-galactofuranosyltransferase